MNFLKRFSRKRRFVKKLISENMDLMNERNAYKTIIQKHNLMNEVNELLHQLMPELYDEKGRRII